MFPAIEAFHQAEQKLPAMNVPQLSAPWLGKGLRVKGTPWRRQFGARGPARVRNSEAVGSGHQTKALEVAGQCQSPTQHSPAPSPSSASPRTCLGWASAVGAHAHAHRVWGSGARLEGMCKTRTLSPPDTDSGMASKHTATHTHAWDTSPQCHRTGLGSARTQTCTHGRTHGHMHTPRRLMT